MRGREPIAPAVRLELPILAPIPRTINNVVWRPALTYADSRMKNLLIALLHFAWVVHRRSSAAPVV